MSGSSPEYRKAYYAKNKEKFREYHKLSRERIPKETRALQERIRAKRDRQAILDAFGGKCACCGESEPRFLELDHIHGTTEEERKNKFRYRGTSSFGKEFYRRVKREGYPMDKYRLLCSNCNRGRWRNGGQCPHESIAPLELSFC